jgi:hypothetical protein
MLYKDEESSPINTLRNTLSHDNRCLFNVVHQHKTGSSNNVHEHSQPAQDAPAAKP